VLSLFVNLSVRMGVLGAPPPPPPLVDIGFVAEEGTGVRFLDGRLALAMGVLIEA